MSRPVDIRAELNALLLILAIAMTVLIAARGCVEELEQDEHAQPAWVGRVR